MKIKLRYFKQSGKYYSQSSYETKLVYHHEIVMEVVEMRDKGKLPGLVEDSREFVILAKIPIMVDGQQGEKIPHLIFPRQQGNRSVSIQGNSYGNTIITGDVKGDFVGENK